MLTRLRVSGFKNLIDVDIYFGPFTCIAGPNGSGKSNLFDAITFLGALSSDTLMNAASRIRDDRGRTTNIRNIFHRLGSEYEKEMTFIAEMLIPNTGVDDLGQQAKASITFVEYTLSLKYRGVDNQTSQGAIEITREELNHINIGDALKHLKFPHKLAWRKSVVSGRKTTGLITTQNLNNHIEIKLHQDQLKGGRPRSFLADSLPRTVLSTVNAAESPTALLTRREMQSWRLLQLEPSALREPDDFSAKPSLGSNGSHLPATLYSLSKQAEKDRTSSPSPYDQVTFSLGGLIDDVRDVRVDPDSKRELYTLEVADRYNTYYPARSLSDGTLRFLALAVLKVDPRTTGLICLEEPENGIHPERIPAILQILQDIAVDPNSPIGDDNPLRQVIINTHSPAVVSQVDIDSLLVVSLSEKIRQGIKYKVAAFQCIRDTWRVKTVPKTESVAPGKLLSYLNPVKASIKKYSTFVSKQHRVVDLPEYQLLLPFPDK
jgi:predicted ATPase